LDIAYIFSASLLVYWSISHPKLDTEVILKNDIHIKSGTFATCIIRANPIIGFSRAALAARMQPVMGAWYWREVPTIGIVMVFHVGFAYIAALESWICFR